MSGDLIIALFKSLFGSYQPIQNVISTDADGIVTYSYSIDWAIICHYALVVILFWCVCKCIATLLLNVSKGVAVK